jgi:hypothetical protein
LVLLVYRLKTFMFLISLNNGHDGTGLLFRVLDQDLVMDMSWHSWGKGISWQLVEMMENVHLLMYGPWILPPSLMNGVSWNQKGKVHLPACKFD